MLHSHGAFSGLFRHLKSELMLHLGAWDCTVVDNLLRESCFKLLYRHSIQCFKGYTSCHFQHILLEQPAYDVILSAEIKGAILHRPLYSSGLTLQLVGIEHHAPAAWDGSLYLRLKSSVPPTAPSQVQS